MKKLFTDGKFYIENGVFAEAILTEGDRILAVGDRKDLEGDEDEVITFGGRTVLPGLNDSHLHLWQVGNAATQIDLTKARSIDDVVEISKKFIKDHKIKPGQAVFGRGWNQDYFTDEKRLLNRHDLDRISREHPIVLDRVCVHVTVLNSKALEELNIPEGKVIEGGEIRRDENGEYTGIFTENACDYARTVIPADTREDVKKKFRAGIDHALESGLTAVQSCDIMGGDYKTYFDVLKELYLKDGVKLRYYPQFHFRTLEEAKEYIEHAYAEDIYDDTFQRGAWKLFKDGSLGGRTALMRKPYHDDPSTKGVSAISDEDLARILEYAEKQGVRLVCHSIGDGAVQSMIDVYSAGMRKGNPLRHGIVHCQITDKKQLREIAENKITVHYQPIFLEYDMTIAEDRVGKELASTSYAFKSMYDMDPNLTSYGTDAPVEDLNPFPCIYSAVTRKRLNGEPEGGFYPEERVTVEEAIDNYTLGSAYSMGMEDRLGRLKKGYYADFVVLDRDIFTIDEDEIKDVKPVATYIGGEVAWEK